MPGRAQLSSTLSATAEAAGRLRRRVVHRVSAARGRAAGRSPLVAAAGAGDVEAVLRLLRAGDDPRTANAWGWTALHEAVARGHAEIAAALLAYGARPEAADRWGHAALAPGHTTPETLHAVRQRYHRFPRPRPGTAPASERARGWARALERDGIVRIPGLVDAEGLRRLRQDFDRFIAALDAKVARGEAIYRHYDEEEHWWPADRAYVCNNAFKYSTRLAELCCDDTLLSSAELHVGTPPVIQRGVAMRYLPMPSVSNDMFGWHHDMEEKRVKMMLLLTDVGPRDQHMSYVVGSHRLFHPYPMFFANACSLEYCGRHLPAIEVHDAVGNAGDAFLFDSNGAHRGIRRESGRVRDVLLVELSADRSDLWGGDVAPEALAAVPRARNPFLPFLAAEKRWTRGRVRRHPTWVETLPRVDAWLAREPAE
jgi:hypothetical protein